MDKAFKFIKSLDRSFFDVFGNPTIKVFDDFCEVYFDSSSTIRGLTIFSPLDGFDEFRFFPNDGLITYVFTFYCD